MATTNTPKPRPGRALLALLIAMGLGLGMMALTKTWTPKLGLDLVGGTSILLQAEPPKGQAEPTPEQLLEAVNIIRNRVGDLAEAEVTTQGSDHILVEVPGAGSSEIRNRVGQTAELRFRQVLAEAAVAAPVPTTTPKPSTSPSGKPSATPSGKPSTPTPTPTPSSKSTITNPSPSTTPKSKGRALSSALTAPSATPTPTPSATPSTPAPKQSDKTGGQTDAEAGKVVINKTGPTAAQQAQLAAFKCIDKKNRPKDDPDQPLFTCDREGRAKYLLGPAIVQGTQLTDAQAGVPQNRTDWVVNIFMNGRGGDNFATASTQMFQLQQPLSQFAIVLDQEVISAPVIQSAITGGEAMIEGNFTEQEAMELAQVLKYGSLPLSFKEEEVATVSPTLGSDQLQGGLLAGGIGLVLVVLYSFFYYRGLGFVVVSSLAIAAAMTYEAAVLLGEGQGFTLTLAGIAGLIVAIGITADSFVVYFERLRDEVRDGKSLRTAVETAWVRARRTVLAADSISLLAALVLYMLSIGNVRSFAFALGLTTVIDLVVVFLFTKPLLTLLARTKFFGSGHRFSGLNAERLGVKGRKLSPGLARTAAAEGASPSSRKRSERPGAAVGNDASIAPGEA